jgi:hypothetical protein
MLMERFHESDGLETEVESQGIGFIDGIDVVVIPLFFGVKSTITGQGSQVFG